MKNYCDFNPKLFKSFISMKEKIIPAIADDWEIVPEQYNTVSGFSLRSETLNQEVADIPLRKFLRFCKEQDLSQKGLKLKGRFIIGNDRAVYTERMYNTWRDKYGLRMSELTDKSALIVGHKYKTPCGKELVYLGARYVANIKIKSFEKGDFNEYTKIKKVHYVLTGNSYHPVKELKNKLTTDLGRTIEPNEADEKLKAYYRNNQEIVCFEKVHPTKVQYGLIRQEIPEKYEAYHKYEHFHTLIFKGVDDETYYSGTSRYCELVYYGPKIPCPELKPNVDRCIAWEQRSQKDAYDISQRVEPGFYPLTYEVFDANKLTGSVPASSYYSKRRELQLRVKHCYRIGIIKADTDKESNI